MPNFSGVWNLKDQVQAIAAGRWTGIATFELYAWGSNAYGQLGLEDIINRSSPVQVGALENWSKVSSSPQSTHAAAIKTDGTLWAWGRNNHGQLGLGDAGNLVSRSSPVQVGALADWSQVGAGRFHSAAVKTDGTLWAWGRNAYGQIGDNTVVYRSSPVQVGALTNWYQVFAGRITAAIKTDGTLWTWGYNSQGQLGDGTVIRRSSPVQVGALTNWSVVSGGSYHTASVKTDGTLWTWGDNGRGQLGDNTFDIPRSSPVQIGALTTWATTTCGGRHTAAVKTDGTIWAWGFNDSGQVGDTSIAWKSSPVQIGALTNWSQVSAGQDHTVSVKTDGTAWAWGKNSSGELGDGTVVNKSSPIQVGILTKWARTASGAAHTIAVLEETTN